MELQEKIRRLIEFMNIPDFEQIISAKLLELEITLGPQIRHMQDLKTKFKALTRREMELLETDGPEKTQSTYYFELKRVKNESSSLCHQWVLWDISPDPVNDIPEAVLEDLGMHIGTLPVDPYRIRHREVSAEASGRRFEISFVKYAGTYAFGAFREDCKGFSSLTEGKKRDMIKLSLEYRKFKKEDSYGELFRYLEAYPEIRERLLTYFYMVEKPAAKSPGT
ncbi:MAG: hypothetical protein GY765_33460 [bacterium]|nr:hypothetical protein [bacterium]